MPPIKYAELPSMLVNICPSRPEVHASATETVSSLFLSVIAISSINWNSGFLNQKFYVV